MGGNKDWLPRCSTVPLPANFAMQPPNGTAGRRLASRPWPKAYLNMKKNRLKSLSLKSAHKKKKVGPLVATNGIRGSPKLIDILTLVQGTYDLNLKKIEQEL